MKTLSKSLVGITTGTLVALALIACGKDPATPAATCANFSGTFIEGGTDTYTMEQNGCTSIRYINSAGYRMIYTDGVCRSMHDGHVIRRDARGLPLHTCVETRFEGNTLVEIEHHVVNGREQIFTTVKTIDAQGNLVVQEVPMNNNDRVSNPWIHRHMR